MKKTSMQIALCMLVVILMLGQTFAAADEMQGQAFAGADETYRLETSRHGEEDVLTVTNRDGELVAIIDAYPEDGYQIVKPTTGDENVCFVMHFGEGKDENRCYERAPYFGGADLGRLAECEDREIYLLRPVDCFQVEKGRVERAVNRHKRFCRSVPRSRCVREERYCRRHGWWSCKSWGVRCAKYEIVTEYEGDC